MTKLEEAEALLQNVKPAEGVTEVVEFLRSWMKYDEGAAEKILAKGKTPENAFMAVKDAAMDKAKNGAYNMPQDEFYAETLKYYGLSADDASDLLEHGLMYRILSEQREAEMEKWKPYGADEPKALKAEAPKPKPSAAKFDLNLGDLL